MALPQTASIPCPSHRLNCCGDFKQLLRDVPLADFVGLQGKLPDEFLCVIGGLAHSVHAGSIFAGKAFKQNVVDLMLNISRQQESQQLWRFGLKDVFPHNFSCPSPLILRTVSFNWQQLDNLWSLNEGIDKLTVNDMNLVNFTAGEPCLLYTSPSPRDS